MKRFLQRLWDNDPSITSIDTETLENVFAEELKKIKMFDNLPSETARIEDGILRQLIEVFRYNTTVTKVSLGSSMFIGAAQFLQNLESFTFCKLENEMLTDIRHFTAILGGCKHLKTFWVTSTFIQINQDRHYVDFLNQLYRHQSIETFAWANTYCYDNSNNNNHQDLDGPVFTAVATMPQISRVVVRAKAPHIFMCLWNGTKIERLSLSCDRKQEEDDNGVNASPTSSLLIPSAFVLKNIFQSFHHLKHLAMNMLVTDEEASQIFASLTHCIMLEQLELDGFCHREGITDLSEPMTSFLRSTQSLRKLHMKNLDLQETTGIARALGFCESLREIKLVNCDLDDEFIQDLAQGMVVDGSHWSNITTLYIRDNYYLSYDGWEPFLLALRSCTTLEHLTLGCDDDEIIQGDWWEDGVINHLITHNLKSLNLCQAFTISVSVTNTIARACRTLEELDLTFKDFTDEECSALSSAIRSSNSLKKAIFDIRNSIASYQSMIELAKGIEANQSLISLHLLLRNEDMNPDTMTSIQSMLETRDTLEFKLELGFTRTNDNKNVTEALTLVDQYDQLNKLGRKELLESDSKERWLQGLLATDDNISLLYYIIRKTPQMIISEHQQLSKPANNHNNSRKKRRLS